MRKKDVFKVLYWSSLVVVLVGVLLLASDDSADPIPFSVFMGIKLTGFVVILIGAALGAVFHDPVVTESVLYSIVGVAITTFCRRNSVAGRKYRVLFKLRDNCNDVKEFMKTMQTRYVAYVRKQEQIEQEKRINEKLSASLHSKYQNQNEPHIIHFQNAESRRKAQ